MGLSELFFRAEASDRLQRDAPLAGRSWNEAERTFEVVFSTGSDVERSDVRGAYIERLDLAQDWSSFRGAPVLNSHRRGDVGDIFGSVVNASTVGNEARATIRMSKRPEAEAVVQDILAGHIRGVSVGYRVSEWRDGVEAGQRVRTATKWRPVELSLVAVPADPQATVRGNTMDPILTNTPPPVSERAAINVEIRGIARTAGLPQSWIDQQIDGLLTVEAASRNALLAMQARSAAADSIRTGTASIGFDANDPEWRCATIGEALACRMTGATPSPAAAPYAGLSTLEIARDALRARNLQTTGSPGVIIERALSTSDLPALMGDALDRTMRQAYSAAPSGLKRVSRQQVARDFRKRHRIQLSAAPDLEAINELGEFRSGAVADTEETYSLSTYGKIVAVSRQVLVNDDLSALSDLTRRLGESAARFEAQKLVDALEANPALSDGFAVFSTQHGNLAAAGAVIAEASLSAGRLAMRQQTGLQGELIDCTPRFIVIPPSLETLAEKTVTSIQAVQTVNVNPFSFLSIVVEPRLSDPKKWWITADPSTIEGLEHCYLEGQVGPQIFSEIGFDVDGLKYKIRLDFAVAWVEPRGWYQQPGA
jgi:HK97 family phage prohead protease